MLGTRYSTALPRTGHGVWARCARVMNAFRSLGHVAPHRCLRTLRHTLAAAVLALLIGPAALLAATYPVNQCPADRYGDTLGCTAGDVSITGLKVVGDMSSCTGGTNISLDLEVSINFATPDRWDVGVFISNDGKDPQILSASGGASSCSVAVLPNESPFLDLDPGPHGGVYDTCGDGNGTIGGGTGNGVFYMTDVTVPCQSAAGAGGKLYVPFVVSWDNQKSPPGDVCTSNANPVPGTKSKCNAPTILQGSIDVVVLPEISIDDGETFISSGSTVDYAIVVSNTTGATLSGAVLTDPAVAGLTANSLGCSAAGGATCPGGLTVAALQGAGLTLPDMPAGGSLTFTLNATLSGNPPATLTNTAYVTVNSQVASASDTDTFAGVVAIDPASQAKQGAAGYSVSYTYTVYNFGPTTDTIGLAAVSSHGWTTTLSTPSVTVAANGSANVTVTVQVPAGATVGTAGVTTVTAISGISPANRATATAVTTVSDVLTFVPDNAGSGAPGATVWYGHRVQNNSDASLTVYFLNRQDPLLSCPGWDATVYRSDRTTEITLLSGLTLAAGGYEDIYVKVTIPASAASNDTCTYKTTARWGLLHTASVSDTTTVKKLILFSDPGYTDESYIYPQGNSVYAKVYGLTNGTKYYFLWYDPAGTLMRTSPPTSGAGTSAPDTYPISASDPLGKWTVKVCTTATCSSVFSSADFWVGPDHLKASYGGVNPATNTHAEVTLALHDRYGHVVPFDAGGSLVKGNPPRDSKDPLKITVTVSGSATIVSTTLSNATISGQTVTGRLSDTSGTATVTITDSVAETVTVSARTYDEALYGSPVRDEAATVLFVAAPTLDHVRLEHTGAGLTCMPASVTVKACTDAACSTVSPDSVTVTLSPAGGWSTNPITFTGSTTVTLSSATAQTLTLGTSAVTPAPAGTSPQCYVGATADCALTFADTGFIFAATADGMTATVPPQVAGANSGTYYLRAVKRSDSTGACTAALDGAQQVDFAYECNNPASCYGSNLMSVNGGTATTIPRNNNGSALTYTAVDLTFDANGNAPFTFAYSDVGQVTLHASKTVNAALLTGATNAFVVKPAGFVLSGIAQTAAPNTVNPAASDADGGKFVQAGEAFGVTVTAVGATGVTTPSYGRESPAEGVKLASNLVAPSGGAAGNLSGSFGGFSNGVASGSGSGFRWDEVGIITLTPSVGDANYLGAGDVSGTTSGNIGRFYPASFAVTHTHAPGCGGFTYAGLVGAPATKLGQPFSVSGGSVTARNVAGTTTANYSGAFAKLSDAGITAEPKEGGAAAAGQLTAWAMTLTPFSGGVGSFSGTDTNRYAFNAEGGPQTVYLKVIATDSDGVTGYEEDNTKTVEYRFGRMRLTNTHGSELLGTINVPFTAEYYHSGGYYTLNTADGCTTLDLATALQLSTDGASWSSGTTTMTIGGGTTSAVLANAPLAGGDAGLSFNGPGAGNTGYLELRGQLTATHPWLMWDWDGDGIYDNGPSARLTFGIYEGSPKQIYLQERY